jgi:hypothetical protein
MEGVKGVFYSKAVWGAIVTVVAGLLGMGHYSVTPSDQASLVDLLASLASTIGGIVAIVGRIVASKKLVVGGAKVVTVMLLAIGLALTLGPIDAHAAHKGKRVSDVSSAAAVAKPATKPSAPTGKLTHAQAQANPVAVLQGFTVADLQAALDDANAQVPPDKVGANCYAALIPLVQSGVANPLPKGAGIFQLIQKIRDAKATLASLQSPSGPLADLNIACAAWILDGQNTLIQLGVITGSVVGTGGLTLPALPGMLPALLAH